MQFEPGVIGVDEVGRGAWAGPLVASAVIFYKNPYEYDRTVVIRDSKKMTERQREKSFMVIQKSALIIRKFVSNTMIDAHGIQKANSMAFKQVINKFIQKIAPNEFLGNTILRALNYETHTSGTSLSSTDVLFDAKKVPSGGFRRSELRSIFKIHADGREIFSFSSPYTYMVRGEEKSLAIAAASIVAKVARDRFMKRMARQYPGYGFERHKGYGTCEHHDALQRLGLCKIHRRSFRPIREMFYTHPCVSISVLL